MALDALTRLAARLLGDEHTDEQDAELRATVEAELLPEVRRRLEPKIRLEVRAEVERAVRVEMQQQKPSQEDRQVFRAHLHQLELEALTQAEAHDIAMGVNRSGAGRAGWFSVVAVGAVAGLFVPLFIACVRIAHPLWRALASIGGVGAIVALGSITAVWGWNGFKAHIQDVVEHRRQAVKYRNLAREIRAYRIVTIRSATTKNLVEAIEEFDITRTSLDNGPPVEQSLVDRASERVTSRRLAQEDTSEFLRIADELSPPIEDETEAKRERTLT